jgi:hypothetical protein
MKRVLFVLTIVLSLISCTTEVVKEVQLITDPTQVSEPTKVYTVSYEGVSVQPSFLCQEGYSLKESDFPDIPEKYNDKDYYTYFWTINDEPAYIGYKITENTTLKLKVVEIYNPTFTIFNYTTESIPIIKNNIIYDYLTPYCNNGDCAYIDLVKSLRQLSIGGINIDLNSLTEENLSFYIIRENNELVIKPTGDKSCFGIPFLLKSIDDLDPSSFHFYLMKDRYISLGGDADEINDKIGWLFIDYYDFYFTNVPASEYPIESRKIAYYIEDIKNLQEIENDFNISKRLLNGSLQELSVINITNSKDDKFLCYNFIIDKLEYLEDPSRYNFSFDTCEYLLILGKSKNTVGINIDEANWKKCYVWQIVKIPLFVFVNHGLFIYSDNDKIYYDKDKHAFNLDY